MQETKLPLHFPPVNGMFMLFLGNNTGTRMTRIERIFMISFGSRVYLIK